MGSSLLWQKVIIGLKGLNVILILCVDLVPVQRGHYEISLKLYWKEIVSKVWFWDNDGMGQDMWLKCGRSSQCCGTKPQSFSNHLTLELTL